MYRKRMSTHLRRLAWKTTKHQWFQEELGKRLGKFGLEVEPTKTKMMEFGRFAVQHAKRKGERAETFDFLGFTHYCGTRRGGKGFRMKRVTARKKFVAKLKLFKEWLKNARNMKTKDLWETAQAKLRGHYNYYDVTDNLRGIAGRKILEAEDNGDWRINIKSDCLIKGLLYGSFDDTSKSTIGGTP
jgi:hypothetical protein